ncbi:hypothetical protein SAMN05518683_11436 [Salibacterium halotolerans]|uniref:Uncharacterized protein n=1 Tax=Salibacterium halotolerans TaxID=1884432 RepID=A0A1I5USF7_9BACI|nr:hypothetical protein SAMN05518683_11436 [Salibacterium halotolerans]
MKPTGTWMKQQGGNVQEEETILEMINDYHTIR